MAQTKFANNAISRLAGSLSNSATSLTVASTEGAKFPALSGGDWFMVTLAKVVSGAPVYEIVKVTARAGDVFTIVRAQEGTTATTFSSGDTIENRATAGSLGAMIQATGGTLTGPLSVPAGATGAQAPQAQEVVSKAGDTISGTLTLNGASNQIAALLANAAEKISIVAAAATGAINLDATTQALTWYTTAAGANWTLNVRGNGANSLDSLLGVGQALTVAFMATQGPTAFRPTTFQVDGNAVTPKWQGGTAPTAGNVSSIDIYTLTIVKTAAATFTVLASQTQFK